MKWFIKSRVLFSTVTRVLTLVCRFPDLGQLCLAVNLDLSRRDTTRYGKVESTF